MTIARSLPRQLFVAPPCPHLRFRLQRQLLTMQRHGRRSPMIYQMRLQTTDNQPIRSLRSRNGPKYPVPSADHAQASRPRQKVVFNMASIRQAIKEHPYQGGLAIVIIAGALAFLIVIIGFEIFLKYFVPHNFPDDVAQALRKAIFFTNFQPDPTRALRFYKEALFLSQEAGLHPVSDEVLGIKIQMGKFFEEKVYSLDNAINVYESIYRDCIEFLTTEGDKHFEDGHRTRVLERAVRTAVRLGEIYGMPQIKRFDDSEEILTIATETVLKERQRRKEQGVVAKERDFLDDEEVGGSMERLAEAYSRRNKSHLAAPLYLHAITLCPPDSCHSVVLMNNLASAIADQPAPPPGTPLPKDFPSPSQQAERWARQALQLAANIPAAKRNEECVTGCATAKANIAELIERDGRLAESLKFFKEAEKEARSVAFAEGIKVSSEGRRRVEEAIKAQAP